MSASVLIYWLEENLWNIQPVSSITEPKKRYGEVFQKGEIVKARHKGVVYPGMIIHVTEDKDEIKSVGHKLQTILDKGTIEGNEMMKALGESDIGNQNSGIEPKPKAKKRATSEKSTEVDEAKSARKDAAQKKSEKGKKLTETALAVSQGLLTDTTGLSSKIDPFALLNMDDASLSKYVQKEGDRISARAFCKDTQTTDEERGYETKTLSLENNAELEEKSGNRRNELLQSLRKRERRPVLPSFCGGMGRNTRRSQNIKNASKPTRRIEYGWSNYNRSENRYKQVRKPNGGGTREDEVPKDTMKEKLIDIGKSYFFPSGVSLYANVNECNFDLSLDPGGLQLIPQNETVEATFQRTRLRPLKYYLLSHGKGRMCPSDSGDSDSDDSLPVSINRRPVRRSNRKHIQSTSHEGDTEAIGTSLPNCSTAMLDISETTKKIGKVESSLSNEDSEDILTHVLQEAGLHINNADDDISFKPFTEETTVLKLEQPLFDDLEMTFASDTSTFEQPPSMCHICVHRGHVFRELVEEFLDRGEDSQMIFKFQMILPNGQLEVAEDEGGVARDTLTEFWDDFYGQCTIGTQNKVPYLRHDFTARRWKAIARVMLLGWKQEGFFPVKIAKPFLEYCLFDEVSEEDVLSSFMDFVPCMEKVTLSAVLDNFESVDSDDLLDVLSNHNVKVAVTPNNITKVLREVSDKELIQEPMFIIKTWRGILTKMGITKERLAEIYHDLDPTNKRVLKSLKLPTSLSAAESNAANHLKRYIRELSAPSLKDFLRYTTGANIMIVKDINISFVQLSGAARRPVAHTCGCTLEIPTTYDNYPEFRYEFDNVLASKVWIMDIV